MLGTKTPVTVAIVATFVWITGAVGMIHTGQALWRSFGSDEISAVGGPFIFFFALSIGFVFNLLIISLSSSLLRGNNGARIVVSIAIFLQALLCVLAILSAGGDAITLWVSWICLFLNIGALVGLLIVDRAYFRK
jgi:hypothetical protein